MSNFLRVGAYSTRMGTFWGHRRHTWYGMKGSFLFLNYSQINKNTEPHKCPAMNLEIIPCLPQMQEVLASFQRWWGSFPVQHPIHAWQSFAHRIILFQTASFTAMTSPVASAMFQPGTLELSTRQPPNLSAPTSRVSGSHSLVLSINLFVIMFSWDHSWLVVLINS